MKFLDYMIELLENLAPNIPLELFVLIGTFVEEVMAPIPSPMVMALAGTIAEAKNMALWYLLPLSFLGAIGKTLGAWVLYILADKLEDLVIGKLGKYLGVSHREIEGIGKKFNGGWKDNVVLFIIRMLPIVPSAPVSLACGVIKINIKTYLSSTFAGTFFRNLMYLYLGYAGLESYKNISKGFESIESIGQVILVTVVSAIVAWSYYKRKKNKQQI